jgi:calcineurin-like phosphoesterase family protein
MNFIKAKKLFEHTLTSEERVSKRINDALFAMIDEDTIEAASSLVSAAVHGTERVWMTSDLHFGHTNIIKYCGRPFPTIGHQDDTIIRLLSKVAPDELIVFVGDLALGYYQDGVDILKKLPGKKILVAGNHDITKEGECRLAKEGIFEYVVPFLYFRGVQEDQVLVSHYPIVEFFPLGVKRLLNYHGHLHQWRKEDTEQIKYVNVGWDQTYGMVAL